MKKLDTDKYLDISFDEADCYQFGSLLYQDYFGYPLPSLEYQLDEIKTMLTAADNSQKQTFIDVEKNDIQYLDGIVFHSVECGRHVGFYIGDGLFIHQNINGFPSIEKLKNINWQKILLGIYRYEP
jgi:hypothetical protein